MICNLLVSGAWASDMSAPAHSVGRSCESVRGNLVKERQWRYIQKWLNIEGACCQCIYHHVGCISIETTQALATKSLQASVCLTNQTNTSRSNVKNELVAICGEHKYVKPDVFIDVISLCGRDTWYCPCLWAWRKVCTIPFHPCTFVACQPNPLDS